jgi:hypothetical protein
MEASIFWIMSSGRAATEENTQKTLQPESAGNAISGKDHS